MTMTTTSGCCTHTTARSLETRTGAVTPRQTGNHETAKMVAQAVTTNPCQETCCAGDEQSEIDRTGSISGPYYGTDTCCAAGPSISEGISSKDTCYFDKHSAEDLPGACEPSCEAACCAQQQTDAKAPEDPECCIGKPSPCCDSSCLDRLAARECRRSTSFDREKFPQIGWLQLKTYSDNQHL